MSSVFTHVMKPVRDTNGGPGVTVVIACVASVSVWFRSKERGTRVKLTARKMAQVKERGGGGEERKETLADKPRDFENRPLGLSCLSARTNI